MPFTGGLLLANDFVQDLYAHMGFHPAWKFHNVREVLFEAGRLTGDIDRAAEMAEVRTKFIEQAKSSGERVGRPADVEIEAWIEKCFSREY